MADQIPLRIVYVSGVPTIGEFQSGDTIPSSIAPGGGGAGGSSYLSGMQDVEIVDLQEKQHLMWNGTDWVNVWNDTTEILVRNGTGSTIYKGDAVHVTGAHSADQFNVELADASDSSKMPAIGILDQDLAPGATGVAITFGLAKGLVTSGLTEGATAYVSPTTPGGITDVKPTDASHLIQNIGIVVKAHATNGFLKVTGVGRANDIDNQTRADIAAKVNKELVGHYIEPWEEGSGDQNAPLGWTTNSASSLREFDTDPFGNQSIIWKAIDIDVNLDGEGGFHSGKVPADSSSLHRFSCFIKQENAASGNVYFGVYAYSSLDGGVHDNRVNARASNAPSGTGNANRYFVSNQPMPSSDWYLAVAYLLPYQTETGPSSRQETALYKASTGERVSFTIYDQMLDDPTAIGLGIRAYYYNNPAGTGDAIQFFQPRIDIVDGNEPSIADLLGIVPRTDYVLSANNALSGLTDTNISSPSHNEALVWTSSTGQWINASLAGGGGVTDHGLLTGLSDNDHPQYLLSSTYSAASGNWESTYGTVNSLSASWEESADITYVSGVVAQNIIDIGTNSTDIGSNTPLIGANTADITNLGTVSGNIAANTADITNLGSVSGNIATNTANLLAHELDATVHFTEAEIDHGSIGGLGDDDHPQYLTRTDFHTSGTGLSGSIDSNTADIANLAAVSGNIATNTANISTNTGNIAANTADITNLGTVSGNIANNTSNISTNTTNIAANTADITNLGSVSGNIATNTSNISTNTSNIAANTADITNLGSVSANIATNTSNISQNALDIFDNATDITTHTGQIGDNTADIANLAAVSGNIATNTSNITANDNDITYLSSVVSGISGGAGALDDLSDVAITSPANGQTLIYNSTAGEFQNATPATGVTDHGLLTGLGDNDHPQYVLVTDFHASGTDLSGSIDANTADITNLGSVSANIATNTGNIATNTGNISTNTTNIAANAGDIAWLAAVSGNIAINTADITNLGSVSGNIATNTGNIAANTADITNLGSVSANIATNTGNIATNTGNISTNTTNIAANTADIANLGTVSGNISTNTTNIAANTADIANLGTVSGNIATNASNLLAHENDNTIHFTEAEIDHGAIGGLGDDDHPQYLTRTDFHTSGTGLSGSIDANTADITNLGSVSGNIATNTGNISTNTTNIAANTADITNLGSVSGNIATNTGNISTNTTNIAANTADITNLGSVSANIATNTTNISANTADISNLGTVSGNIATNTGNISTNTTNIAANTADITNLGTVSGNIATNTSNISTNTGNISTNTTNIAANTADITNLGSVSGNIATNTGNISTNTTNIAANTADITNLGTVSGNIATNTTNISNNSVSIGDNASDIASNTGLISANTADITNLGSASGNWNSVYTTVNTTSGTWGGGGGVTDHGALTGLADDDHTQYLLANGTRTASSLEVDGDLSVTGSANPAHTGIIGSTDVGVFGLQGTTNFAMVGAAIVFSATTNYQFRQDGKTTYSTTELPNKMRNWDSAYDNAYRSLLQVKEAGGSQNINGASKTYVNFDTTDVEIGNATTDFTFNGTDTITINTAATYEISYNITVTAGGTGTSNQRTAQLVRLEKNGTDIGPAAATGYIRITSNHIDASYHMTGHVMDLAATDTLKIGSTRASSSTGSVLTVADQCFWTIRRIA